MPSGGNLHVSRPLSTLSQRYTVAEFIDSQIFGSNVAVAKESDQWYVYNKERRLEDTLRPNGAPANFATYGVSLSSYSLEEHALADTITDRDKANADSPLSLDQDTTENLTEHIMLRLEQQSASLFGTTTNWGNNATLNTATSWAADTTTSNPIGNVLSATGLIVREGGKRPNTIITNWDVFAGLKENSQVYNRIINTERGILTNEILASLFDVDKFLVGAASYNGVLSGNAPSTTFLWGADAWVGYIAPNAGRKTQSAAVRLVLNGSSMPMKVKKWREDSLDADVIQVSTISKPIVVSSQSGYLFKTAAIL